MTELGVNCPNSGEICSLKQIVTEQYSTVVTPEMAIVALSIDEGEGLYTPGADKLKMNFFLGEIDSFATENDIDCRGKCPVRMEDVTKPRISLVSSIKKALGK